MKKGQKKYDKRTKEIWQKDKRNMTKGQKKYDKRTKEIWQKDKRNNLTLYDR
jgi:hypothetical protein